MEDKHRNYNRERMKQFNLKLTDDERFILEQKTKLSGMRSQSAFIRHMILYGYVYDVDYSQLREINVQLARIGSNINQITKRLHATGHVYKDDIIEIEELMNKIWQLQESILSKQPSVRQ